jgi:hypothetical protein
MRSLVALVLLVIGGLMVPVATAGWWLRDTVVPADAYVQTVAPLADDADVQEAVRRTLLARSTEALQELPEPLRDRAEPVVQRAVRVVVDSPAFEKAWREANRAAHRQLVGALAGDSDSVDVRGGSTVVLELDALLDAVRQRVADAGPGFGAAIPEVSATYPVGDVEELSRARTAYNLLEDYGRVLPFVTALLIVLGLVAARRPGAALAGTALLALVGLGLLWFGLGYARSSYVDALPAAVPEDAGRAYFDVLTADLRTSLLYVSAGSGLALLLGAATAGIRRS